MEILPDGKRKRGLAQTLAKLVRELFGTRIQPFDDRAAVLYASLTGKAKMAGHAIGIADRQIAAIAAVHGYTVATRNVEPFHHAGVPGISPWEK